MNPQRRKDQFTYILLAVMFSAVAILLLIPTRNNPVPAQPIAQQEKVVLSGESKKLMDEINNVQIDTADKELEDLDKQADGL